MKLKNILLACIMSSTHFFSLAGSAGPGTLVDVYIMQSGAAIVYTAGSRASPPACATQVTRFAIDATTATGKAQLATLLMAFSSGKLVEFFGTGACSNWGDTESVNYFHVIL